MLIETWFNQDVKKAVKVRYIDGNVFSQDNFGNRVGVCLYDGDTEVSAAGTISGSVIRSDGATVAVTGASSGNKAYVDLPQSAYAIPGLISIVIKSTESSVVTTLCAAVATVYQSSTDSTVDPGTIIPSISTLINEIETAVASIPADYSSLWTSLAPAYSNSSPYAVGDYVTYNGKLYRNTTEIASGESWTSSHWTAVNLGNDSYSLKETVNGIDSLEIIEFIPNKYVSTSGDTVNLSSLSTSTSGLCCAIVPCSAGDVFTLTGTGGSTSARLWNFIDSSGNRLLSCGGSEVADGAVITAPPNTAYLLVNAKGNKYLVKGTTPNRRITNTGNALGKVSGNAVDDGYTLHTGFYINESSFAITSTSQGNLANCLVSVKVKPYTTYVIKKDTSNGIRAVVIADTTITAGKTNYNGVVGTGTNAVEIYTNRCEYILIQMWASSDDVYLRMPEAHIPSLTVTPKYSDAEDTADKMESLFDDTNGNIISNYNVIENLYINGNNIAAPVNSYAYNTNEMRLISVPITGGKTYRIWCEFLRHQNAGTGTVQTPVAGQELNARANNNGTSNFFDIKTYADDTYLYIQLFTSADPVIYAPAYYAKHMAVYECAEIVDSFLPYEGEDIIEINHRGYNSTAPENTIPAFQQSVLHDYKWIECDVYLTSDSIPVVIHDATINRTARNPDGSQIEDTVYVAQSTYEELLQYDFGIWKGQEYAGTKIPTLEQVLNFARKTNLHVAVELKGNTTTNTGFPIVYNMIQYCGMDSYVEVFSGNSTAMLRVKNMVQNSIIGYAVLGSVEQLDSSLLTIMSRLHGNNNRVRLHTNMYQDETSLGVLRSLHNSGVEVVFRWFDSSYTAADAPNYAHIFITNKDHPATVLYNDAMGIT